MTVDTKHTHDRQRTASRQITPAKFIPQENLLGNRQGRWRINRPLVLISAALLLIASIVFFLLTAKAIHIETEPAQSDITIASRLMFKLGTSYLLLPGEHKIALAAPGYYDLEESLVVGSKGQQKFFFQLDKLPGSLKVETGALTGAEVLLDGERKGKTPVVINALPAGRYKIDILLEGYLPHTEEVDLKGLGKENHLKAELLPAWAEVSFTSRPENAELYVDDTLIGQTPLTTNIMQGQHTASVRRRGYKQWQRTLKVTAGEAQRFDEITLAPADATVVLQSKPSAASVTVDGNYQGLTPIEFAVTPDTTARISLFKQGYKPAAHTVKLASGEQKHVTITLAARLVEIVFSVEPADAELYINGKRQAAANTRIQLPARQHNMEVKRDGYVTVSKNISPHSGLVQHVRVRLKSLQEVKRESVQPIIKTSAGQTLKLFRPGEFTAGASRREPGRQANETLQKIRLGRAFYMSLHEVTNAQYKLFKPGHSAGRIQGHSLDQGSHPVTRVSWQDAAKYCNWLSRQEKLTSFYEESNSKIVGINPAADGYRLPTEAEWAWAARTRADKPMLKFPWGGQMPPTEKSGNFADTSSANFIGKIIGGYNDGFPVTAPVGSFMANDKGLFDMGGNVAEWVNDFYDIAVSQKTVLRDPLGPKSGEFYVIRGSGWAHGTITELRLSYRDYGSEPRDDVGFRIARFLE